MIKTKFFRGLVAIWMVGFCLVQGCGESGSNSNPYVGNMNDFSYSGQRTDDGGIYRVNARGEEVCVAEFEGRFVWADYAAPWCKPCLAQAQAIKSLEDEFGEQLVFLTVITSEKSEFQSIPTQQTAMRWAQRFGLDPARVVFATDKWGMTIPTHILFSPTGQTLYRAKGFQSKEQIQAIMARYIRDWQDWSENLTVADWMKEG